MAEKSVELQIADQASAIRYIGEMQSRPVDAVHEPIQNLLDAGARRIDIEIDKEKDQIRVRGDSKPITSTAEMERIMTSICASDKVGRKKLGEKGIGMLSFVTVGNSMTMLSQSGGKTVWMTLLRDNMNSGKVGSDASNRLPYAGTEVRIKGVSPKILKYKLCEDRIIKDVKRRWGSFISNGVKIFTNGKDVSSYMEPLEGDEFKRRIPIKNLGHGKYIDVDLLILKEPSDVAAVSVTHRGQANFIVSDITSFERHNAFTQGMLHGTITGDAVPINASRSGFQETAPAFEAWVDEVYELSDELGKIIAERVKTSAEEKDAEFIAEFMKHLKSVFKGSELESVTTVAGPGEEPGYVEVQNGPTKDRTPTEKGTPGGPKVSETGRPGGPGRLPTVPYGGITIAPPNVRVVRDRKAFRINIRHPDYVLSDKAPNKRRAYIREVCMHEAYIFSLDGERRNQYIDRSDEFLTYWTKAFIKFGKG